jgi:putative tricarboxylic transport membrane protein
MLGALMLYNITPGPQLFTENATLAGAIIASMYLGNILLLVMNVPLIGVFVRLLQVPNTWLVPGIVLLSILGVYSAYSSSLSLLLMLGIGVIGYGLRKLGFDMAPIVLGFVLGKIFETNLRNALAISGGDPAILFQSPTSWALWIMALVIVVLPAWLARRRRAQQAAEV